jgi:hypothetical protein
MEGQIDEFKALAVKRLRSRRDRFNPVVLRREFVEFAQGKLRELSDAKLLSLADFSVYSDNDGSISIRSQSIPDGQRYVQEETQFKWNERFFAAPSGIRLEWLVKRAAFAALGRDKMFDVLWTRCAKALLAHDAEMRFKEGWRVPQGLAKLAEGARRPGAKP